MVELIELVGLPVGLVIVGILVLVRIANLEYHRHIDFLRDEVRIFQETMTGQTMPRWGERMGQLEAALTVDGKLTVSGSVALLGEPVPSRACQRCGSDLAVCDPYKAIRAKAAQGAARPNWIGDKRP